jgi:RNA polymerase sigma-70 factor (ECF subfamily)
MSRTRPKHLPLDDIVASSSSVGDGDESTKSVRGAVDRLSKSGREVILLHYFSGLSYEEIGTALGISLQSVHGRLQRARRSLARELTEIDQ